VHQFGFIYKIIQDYTGMHGQQNIEFKKLKWILGKQILKNEGGLNWFRIVFHGQVCYYIYIPSESSE
jgi:hypothetical protein